MQQYDLIVVGGGIAGLGLAWAAAKEGQAVAVFDTNPRAEGASIRNFGMIWPIGQPAGPNRATALRSRQLWLELGQAAGFPVQQCGSLHLAHQEDEWAVLEEFANLPSAEGLDLQLVRSEEIKRLTPAANHDSLVGGLYSRTELRVTPSVAIRAITTYLATSCGVQFHFASPVVNVVPGEVTTARGKVVAGQRIVIATGAYFQYLFPQIHREEQLRVCKLQMMITEPQPSDWKLGPHLAGGLTLRHYPSFADCPTLPAYCQRITRQLPELDRFGIHVMASQAECGGLILGDSHEYGDDIEIRDKAEIEQLILQELRKIISVPNWNIARRWQGFYAKHPSQTSLVREVAPDVLVVNGFGGNGMTLALAVTESVQHHWEKATQGESLYGSH
ncbi:TIGR03364 family FAD-dependent oxidoreductase [bacterium]|nr:TIGR03364 family FAD-dependent oxidoreductase [bacterium]